MSGACAKVTVSCVIDAPRGPSFTGTNAVRNPQATCPRPAGAGYAGYCDIICRQEAHAEIQALKAAGKWAVGATATVHFHRDDRPGHVCSDCQTRLAAAGVRWLVQTWGTTTTRTVSSTPLPIVAPVPYPVGSPVLSYNLQRFA